MDSPERLGSELERGHALDRDLAARLGRQAPSRSRPRERWLDTLEGRAPLSPDDERELVGAAQAGDPGARARLVEAFMPLIAAMARTYRSGEVQRAELLQEGVVGLLRALERFDRRQGVPFWGYAAWWVRQAMQQLVSELTRPVVLSDRALRHLARLKHVHGESLRETGREPTRDELAERSGLAGGQVDDLLAVERAPRSLDEPIHSGEGQIGTFGELLADPLAEGDYERVLEALESEQLHALLAGLSDRERAVLRARYGLDGEERSLRAIGEELGLSGERVRQIERRALGKLASHFTVGPG